MPQVTIHADAPVRFCDLGGWTDTYFYPKGAVLNFCSIARTNVTLRMQEASRPIYRFESLDLGEEANVDVRKVREGEYTSTLELVQAALRRADLQLSTSAAPYGTNRHHEMTVQVSSDAPPGSGLGSSAALGVAAVAALDLLRKGYVGHWYDIARLAQDLEVADLKLQCGVQDQMASARGGINFMDIDYPEARVQPVTVAHNTLCELNRRFVIVYTGKSHFSGEMHNKVIAEYETGHNHEHFQTLANCAREGREALQSGDLDAFAKMMNRNWSAQKALHPDITTAEMEELHRLAFAAGAIGGKANGAGGGGTFTFLAGADCAFQVKKAIKDAGYQIIPSKIDFTGVQAWKHTSQD